MEPGLPTASVVRSSQATPARRRGQPCIAANHPQPIHLSHPRLVFKRAEPPLDVQKAKTRQTVNNLFGTDARIFVRLKTLGSGIQDLQIMVQSLRVVEDKLG
jgi:hypothetical protein